MSKVTLDEGDVLVVTVDCGDLPISKCIEHMENVKDVLSLYFLSNKILVIPKEITLQIIKPTPSIEVKVNYGTSIPQG